MLRLILFDPEGLTATVPELLEAKCALMTSRQPACHPIQAPSSPQANLTDLSIGSLSQPRCRGRSCKPGWCAPGALGRNEFPCFAARNQLPRASLPRTGLLRRHDPVARSLAVAGCGHGEEPTAPGDASTIACSSGVSSASGSHANTCPIARRNGVRTRQCRPGCIRPSRRQPLYVRNVHVRPRAPRFAW